jgi:cell division protein FtsI (penicillin-binding protein 3)
VNNPVISVAVIIDTPKGSYYGASVSAPVFAEVAQQVLEYLGVPHDVDLKPVSATAKKQAPVTEDDSAAPQEDIQALYSAANDLPSDDPENPAANQAQDTTASTTAQPAVPAVDAKNSGASSSAAVTAQPAPAQKPTDNAQTATIQLPDDKKLRVPALIGLPVRDVIEQAGAAGLEVQISGNGTAREQAPAPGTMVAAGTKIVVRCAR